MAVVKLNWDVNALGQTRSDTVTDCLDKLFLSWFSSVINSEDILAFRWSLMDFLDHASQVGDVDGRHQVVALAYNRETLWILQPSLLEVRVKHLLALPVENTG